LRAGAPAAEDPPASNAFAARWKTPDAAAAEAETATVVEEDTTSPLAGMAPPAEPEFHHHQEPEFHPFDAEAVEEAEPEAESLVDAHYHGLAGEADHDEPYADADDDDEPPKPVAYEAYAPTLTAEAGFHAGDDLEAMQAVADAIGFESFEQPETGEEEPETPVEAEGYGWPEEPEESLRPSTHEMIAQPKAGAFSGQAAAYSEEEAEEEAGTITFSDLGARRPRQGHAMRGVLLAGGAAAFMGLAGAGYVALHPEMVQGLAAPAAHPIPVGPASAPAGASAPQAAVALATAPTPQSTTPQATTPQATSPQLTTPPSTAPNPAGQDLDSLYRGAAAKVDLHDPAGVAPLRTAGLDPTTTTPEETAKIFAADRTRWGAVVRDNHIKAE